MWNVAHSKATTTDSWAMERGLSGGFGTSKSAKSCMDKPLVTKSEGLYIVQMSLLVGSDYGGCMNNHMKTGQLSINSGTGHLVLMQRAHGQSSQGSGRGHGRFPPS